ncbi:hypothetical protein J4407_00795 [Candidatus Pacearchaeota archaeon]|nr:hypothetical protein [Candidatus Pacearchaeota archaeon]
MLEINKDGLLKFLSEAGKKSERDFFRSGDWQHHSLYVGGIKNPLGVDIFFKGNFVWKMRYHRQPRDFPEKYLQHDVFPFLKKALLSAPEDMPFRGPKYFKELDFEYFFDMKGDWEYFTGIERILHVGDEVFFQDVMGGLIK